MQNAQLIEPIQSIYFSLNGNRQLFTRNKIKQSFINCTWSTELWLNVETRINLKKCKENVLCKLGANWWSWLTAITLFPYGPK